MADVIKEGLSNGYVHSTGTQIAKQAVIDKFSHPDYPIDINNVFIMWGTSDALKTSLSVLCEEGDNVLTPSPGFPIVYAFCQNLKVQCRYYNLNPDKDWEIDFEQAATQIDPRTKAIYVINPSNPCGSVFTRKHMLEIIEFSCKHKIPIIADEVYQNLNYDEESEFISFGNISKEVPVIVCSSISKIFCMPGWRLGWMIVYNAHGYFDKALQNMVKFSMLQLHPPTFI